MPKTVYVACIVSKGIFESEFYITVRDSSVFVDRINVRVSESPNDDQEGKGRILAFLIEEKSDEALVELTGEPVIGGLRAWIPKADLAFA